MKKLLPPIILASFGLMLLSCSQKEAVLPAEPEGGALCLRLDFPPQTRTVVSEDQLRASALVNIYYADFSGLVRSYVYSEAPERIYLPEGEYRLDIIAGEAAKQNPVTASWELKSYKGSSPFSIRTGENSSVSVEAGISNAVSKIHFDSSVAAVFNTGYSFTIGTSENSKLVYDASRSDAEGYFIISGLDEPAFSWTFNGTLKRSGTAFSKSGEIPGLEPGKCYAVNVKFTETDGDASIVVKVDDSLEIVQDVIVFEAASTGLAPSSPYEIWAAHATVHADVDESEYPDPSKVRIGYRAVGGAWASMPATRESEGVYSARITGLVPSTTYEYKLIIDGTDIGESKTLTTDAAPAVPNGSFENTSKSASGNYYEFYNPSASDPASRTAWWGSGNGSTGNSGSADFGGFIICRPDTDVKADGNQSACLQSCWALVKFAAGNLFSGYFGGLVGTKGGKVYFGRPFTGRPTALKVSLKYSAGKVNRIDSYPSGDPVTTSDYDRARVLVCIGTWDYRKYGGTSECPILINTTDHSTFVDFPNDKSTIAYGEVVLRSDAGNSHNKWVSYTIPLDYKDLNAYPTHILISCASSMLGDYFTGCDESKLWVDKVELVYE